MKNNIIIKENPILCRASEKGKIVVNNCLDRGIKINTLKLEKLLVLMYGKLLSKYEKKLFNQNIICTSNGVKIKEVDNDFMQYCVGFNNKLPEYISLLQSEEYVMNDVLEEYGNLSASELNELYLLKTLKEVFTKENKVNILSPNLIKEVFNYTYYLKRY